MRFNHEIVSSAPHYPFRNRYVESNEVHQCETKLAIEARVHRLLGSLARLNYGGYFCMAPIKLINFRCIILAVVFSRGLYAQTLFGPTYAPPGLRVSPGQIVTVFLSGHRTAVSAELIPQGKAADTILGAFRVTLRQGPPERETPVPLLSIKPYSSCGQSSIACLDRPTLGITMQVPYEATPNFSTIALPITSGGTTTVLSVYENGEKILDQQLNAIQRDAIHIITGCDGANPFLPIGINRDARCWPLATISDGSLLRFGQNVREGDVVILYAYGFGTDTFGVTGAVAPTPAENSTVDAQIDFGVGLGPRVERSRPIGGERNPAVLYAGLSPGSIGLYQINIRIPTVPDNLPECIGNVTSNLTITLMGFQSLDGVRLCASR